MKRRYRVIARVGKILRAADSLKAAEVDAMLATQPCSEHFMLWAARRSPYLRLDSVVNEYVIVDTHTGLVVR